MMKTKTTKVKPRSCGGHGVRILGGPMDIAKATGTFLSAEVSVVIEERNVDSAPMWMVSIQSHNGVAIEALCAEVTVVRYLEKRKKPAPIIVPPVLVPKKSAKAKPVKKAKAKKR